VVTKKAKSFTKRSSEAGKPDDEQDKRSKRNPTEKGNQALAQAPLVQIAREEDISEDRNHEHQWEKRKSRQNKPEKARAGRDAQGSQMKKERQGRPEGKPANATKNESGLETSVRTGEKQKKSAHGGDRMGNDEKGGRPDGKGLPLKGRSKGAASEERKAS